LEAAVSEPQDRPRLEYLRELRDGLQARLAQCESDQNYAVMARELRTVLVEIDELSGGAGKAKETGLSDFEKRLRERQAGAKAPHRAKSS
jgi:hypothetical protein